MQSYADLIVLAIIAGALLLLVLLLVFFILLNRRCNALEAQNAELTSKLTSLKQQLSDRKDTALSAQQQLMQGQESLVRRLSGIEGQLNYLRTTQDECIDGLKQLRDEQGRLQVSQDVQQKLIEERNPEHESLLKAKKLIQSGVDLERVQEICGLPRAELEMLKSVEQRRREKEQALLHPQDPYAKVGSEEPVVTDRAAAQALAALSPDSATDSMQEVPAGAESENVAPPSIEEQAHALSAAFVKGQGLHDKQAPSDSRPAGPVASLRARNAYGIKSLRGRSH